MDVIFCAKVASVAEMRSSTQQFGADYFAITAKAGAKPTIFMSGIAKASQGSVQIPGGKVQVIVPNRSLWSEAVKINPATLKPIQ